MSEPTNDRTAALIRLADRPHRTTDLERDRIRASITNLSAQRFDLELVHDSEAAADPHVRSDRHGIQPDEAGPEAPGRRGAWQRVGVAVLTAAVAFGLIGAIGWFQRSEPDVVPASVPVPAGTPPALVEICNTDVAALDQAVAAWSEIGNWAVSRDGEPDLAALVQRTLGSLAELGVESAELSTTLDEVMDERAHPTRPLGSEFAVHESVVREALVLIVFEVASLDSSLVCPTSGIRRALGR